ncbi:MAG: response regulator transcription factor [Ramlibacter sp.]|nr:response regulator transcription factor [Ramlibacter sp.]
MDTLPAPATPLARGDARILLVDDHALFRAGLAMILADSLLSPRQILEAGSLSEALSLPHEVQVVLLDVELPGVNGIEGLALLRRRWPEAALVVLSANDSGARVAQALQRGANMFVSKTAAPDHIRRVAAQGLREGRRLGHGDPGAGAAAEAAPAAALSARQIDVLTLLCEGLSNKGIANRLALSENTVRNHVVSVLRHFDANTRTEAVMAAQRAGVVRLPPAP